MTRDQIAPWSQLDDELDESGGIASASEDGARSQGGAEDAPLASDSARGSGLGRRALNVAPHWALVPLAVAVAWITWGIVSTAGKGIGIPTSHALGILAFLLAACGLVLMSRIARRAALASIYQAISQNTTRAQQVFEDLPIAAELRPLWQATKQHTVNIEKRVADLLEEHKQLSLALSLTATRKRHLEAIKDSVPDPVLVTDVFDQLIVANPAAENVFGFDCEEALRKPLASVISDEDVVRMVRQAREADSRAAHRRAECEIGSRTYSLTMSPVNLGADTNEPPLEGHGIVLRMRDITKEREATKMKSEFVARAAHEMRTPLSSIRAYVEMLVDGEAADEKTRAEYYDIIQTSADRLGRMIDNMLNISRIEAGTVRINKEPVAVSMIVKEAIDVARPQAEEKKITLTDDLSPVAYRIMADRDMIYQAVLNLLSNAIKYTPEGGQVHVRMTPHEERGSIGVEVTDTGVGIPKEDLPKMFGKFFRVEANKKMSKGTGLGLNLVKQIVETIHGGKTTLTSEVGKGSTFGMVLPLMS